MSVRSRDVDADDRSITDLLKELTGEVQHLLRAEVELAKLETREELERAKDAGIKFALAFGAAVLGVLLLSFALAWGLAELMPVGVAFLIVGVIYVVVAVIAAKWAREKAKEINPVPEQTVETLKEDLRWAKARSN